MARQAIKTVEQFDTEFFQSLEVSRATSIRSCVCYYNNKKGQPGYYQTTLLQPMDIHTIP